MNQLSVTPYNTRSYGKGEKIVIKIITKTKPLIYTQGMARPKNSDGIRARTRTTDGFQAVHFEEYLPASSGAFTGSCW
jgi:hypothetical protein